MHYCFLNNWCPIKRMFSILYKRYNKNIWNTQFITKDQILLFFRWWNLYAGAHLWSKSMEIIHLSRCKLIFNLLQLEVCLSKLISRACARAGRRWPRGSPRCAGTCPPWCWPCRGCRSPGPWSFCRCPRTPRTPVEYIIKYLWRCKFKIWEAFSRRLKQGFPEWCAKPF